MSSDYERDIAKILVEKNEELEKLRKNSEGNSLRIRSVMEEIEALQALFENYNLGMNYFRRARGGRAGLREWIQGSIPFLIALTDLPLVTKDQQLLDSQLKERFEFCNLL